MASKRQRPDRRLLTVCAVLLGLGALHCASSPYKSEANVDAEYDFSKVRTFAFAMVPERRVGTELGGMLRDAIQSSLVARGFSEVAESKADLWISYDYGTLSASAVTWSQVGKSGTGSISVRAIDPTTKRDVWYGWVEAKLSSDPNPEKHIPEAVEALFENRVGPRNPS